MNRRFGPKKDVICGHEWTSKMYLYAFHNGFIIIKTSNLCFFIVAAPEFLRISKHRSVRNSIDDAVKIDARVDG